MSEPRHQRARIEFVDPLLEQPDRDHLPVHVQQLIGHGSMRLYVIHPAFSRSDARRASAVWIWLHRIVFSGIGV